MNLEELETHPKSKVWGAPSPTTPSIPQSTHIFWMVGDDGFAVRMMWTEDGRMVEVDEHGWT